MAEPVSVIGSKFMLPYTFHIIVEKTSSGNLVITDTNHTTMLKVNQCDTSFHLQRQVFDAHDKPLVLIREKNMTLHNRWNVFRGDRESIWNKICTAKEAHMVQIRSHVHVFLETQTSSCNDVCDFNIKGSWSKRNCTIYMGDTSSSPIAQMHKMPSSKNVEDVNNKFMVTISPNVDYAFVVTLLAIVDAMETSDTEDQQADAMETSDTEDQQDDDEFFQFAGLLVQIAGVVVQIFGSR